MTLRLLVFLLLIAGTIHSVPSKDDVIDALNPAEVTVRALLVHSYPERES